MTRKKVSEIAGVFGLSEAWMAVKLYEKGVAIDKDGTVDTDHLSFMFDSDAPPVPKIPTVNPTPVNPNPVVVIPPVTPSPITPTPVNEPAKTQGLIHLPQPTNPTGKGPPIYLTEKRAKSGVYPFPVRTRALALSLSYLDDYVTEFMLKNGFEEGPSRLKRFHFTHTKTGNVIRFTIHGVRKNQKRIVAAYVGEIDSWDYAIVFLHPGKKSFVVSVRDKILSVTQSGKFRIAAIPGKHRSLEASIGEFLTFVGAGDTVENVSDPTPAADIPPPDPPPTSTLACSFMPEATKENKPAVASVDLGDTLGQKIVFADKPPSGVNGIHPILDKPKPEKVEKKPKNELSQLDRKYANDIYHWIESTLASYGVYVVSREMVNGLPCMWNCLRNGVSFGMKVSATTQAGCKIMTELGKSANTRVLAYGREFKDIFIYVSSDFTTSPLTERKQFLLPATDEFKLENRISILPGGKVANARN